MPWYRGLGMIFSSKIANSNPSSNSSSSNLPFNLEPAILSPDINARIDAFIAIISTYFVRFNNLSTRVFTPCLLKR